ncbi:hypothetical protein EZJ49_00595 [Bdellovibrio bacteriovorus]|uniref:hypothetical protein n=1 Tax=Bdellovibrio bacteriovorus TaxID=959 RepID=UPI0021CF3514|nr:hypothetical protein [Bdellovibrio bacteriovorus]UXR64753.1 hypothetical protein EZJ49_00595 [Bdellovibrio bacteriovorus]
MKHLSVCLSLILFSSLSHATSVLSFRIYSVRELTPFVDRYYGRDGSAFATLFCNDKTSEVMFVDSRYADLDGKVFYFSSQEACAEARKIAKTSRCEADLVLNTATTGATITAARCK